MDRPSLTTLMLGSIFASTAIAHSIDDSPATSSASTHSISPPNMEQMMMTPYFHWMAKADALFFKQWVPHTSGTLAGACIGLFFLALFERFLGGVKGLLEAWWRRRRVTDATRALVTPDRVSTHSHAKSIESGASYVLSVTPAPLIPPFEMLDLMRGGVQALQSLIGFFLMLSVMTYNAAFLISIIFGIGVGEVAFARLVRSGAHPGCVAVRTHG